MDVINFSLIKELIIIILLSCVLLLLLLFFHQGPIQTSFAELCRDGRVRTTFTQT